MNQWFSRPDYKATMENCGNMDIGVWSVNDLDRSVLVAVYGRGDARHRCPPAAGSSARRRHRRNAFRISVLFSDTGVESRCMFDGKRFGVLCAGLGLITGLAVPSVAHADNRRLNDGVVANVYTPSRSGPAATAPTERPTPGSDQSEAAPGRPVAHRRRAEQPRARRGHRFRRVHGCRPSPRRWYAGVVEETVVKRSTRRWPSAAWRSCSSGWAGPTTWRHVRLRQHRHRGVVGEPGTRPQRCRRGLRQG